MEFITDCSPLSGSVAGVLASPAPSVGIANAAAASKTPRRGEMPLSHAALVASPPSGGALRTLAARWLVVASSRSVSPWAAPPLVRWVDGRVTHSPGGLNVVRPPPSPIAAAPLFALRVAMRPSGPARSPVQGHAVAALRGHK
jgi:hypothetical protein